MPVFCRDLFDTSAMMSLIWYAENQPSARLTKDGTRINHTEGCLHGIIPDQALKDLHFWVERLYVVSDFREDEKSEIKTEVKVDRKKERIKKMKSRIGDRRINR